MAVTKTAAIVVFCCTCCVGGPAFAQEEAAIGAGQQTSTAGVDSEVIVRGRGVDALRSEIIRAQEALQHYNAELLREEMRRVVAEDEPFRAALASLATAHEALSVARGSAQSSAASSSGQVPTGEDGLPYDAKGVVEVRMGRKPWTHALTRHTFTLAHISGEIRSIEVECDAREARLQYEAGVEWTIPDAWGSCTLSVDASRDTTFALYEFD